MKLEPPETVPQEIGKEALARRGMLSTVVPPRTHTPLFLIPIPGIAANSSQIT